MDSQLLTVDINVATASLNVRRAGSITPGGIREEAALPGEFSVLKDCICRDGLIWPRPRLVEVQRATTSRRVCGMGEFRNGASGDDWLIVGQSDDDDIVWPVAMLLSQDANVISAMVEKVGATSSSNLLGVPYSFGTYRNQLWAVNGLYAQMFDGRGWSDLNNGRTMISARLVGTAERKLFFANTPTYPDEYTWADANREVSVMSKWPGMEPGGGTGVGVMLNQVVAPAGAFGVFAVGDAGYVLRTLTAGGAWFEVSKPNYLSLQVIATRVVGASLEAFVAGPAGNMTSGNVWMTSSLTTDPATWTEQKLTNVLDVYAAGYDQNAPATIALIGCRTSGGRPEIAYDAQAGAGWKVASITTSRTGRCPLRSMLLITGESRYFACGERDSAGVAILLTAPSGSVATWQDYAVRPTVTAGTADFLALAGKYGPSENVYMGGVEGSTGKIWRLDYPGTTWTALTNPPHVPMCLLSLLGIGGHLTTIYAVGQMGMIVKSVDSGATWTEQDSGVSVALNSIVNYDSDPLHLMAVGDGGVCVTTVDGGTTWVTPGVGDLNPDKIVNSERFGAGESIRAKHQRSGQIAFFTNRGIRVLDEGTMKQQFALDGFETFNDNCIGEHRGMIVILGKLNGTPGIYGWDGSASPPRLLSEAVTGLFRASPGNNYVPCLRCIPDTSDHIWDTEDDFRPRKNQLNPGWAFNESLWAYDNGIMVMRSQPTGASATEITMCGVSKAAAEPDEYGTDGIYVPNVTDWGIISFDYQLYHPADESKVAIQLQVQTAPDVIVGGKHTPGTWTGWANELPNIASYLPHTQQKGAFGRCSMRLLSYANSDNPWLQFRLLCTNLAQNDSDVCINRVILRAVVDGDPSECPAPPCLVVHDDAVYAHFSLDTVTGTPRYEPRCVVLAGDKMQASTIDTGNEIAAARVLNDVLYMGMYWHSTSGSVLSPSLLAAVDDNNTPAVDYIGLSQEIRFMLDFAGLDAVARTLPKDLQKFYLSARPASYAGAATVLVKHKSNDADDPTIDWDSDSLEFSAMHRPEDSLVRHHILDLESALTSENSTGRRFHFIIMPGTDASAPFIIEAAKIAAIVRGEDWPSAYGGGVG
jgi:photosystem II stability/assembly factor-like uncharacterized protein